MHYHPSKMNVIVGALRKLSMGSSNHVKEGKKKLLKEEHQLERLGVRLCNTPCPKKGN